MPVRHRTGLGVFAATLLTAAVLAGPAASAGTAPVIDTGAAVTRALAALAARGVDPGAFVVQTGTRNYAGPSCPGVGWQCTTSTRVVQVGSTATSTSTATCAIACDITQAGAGTHTAACVQSGSDAATALSCWITQNALDAASNFAAVTQLGAQKADTTQTLAAGATIVQTSEAGSNNLALLQVVAQRVSDGGDAASGSQHGAVIHDVTQTSVSGANSSFAQQSVSQLQLAGAATTGSQLQVSKLVGHVDQTSAGVSRSVNRQDEKQTATAPAGPLVLQTQVGPFRCCSNQLGNPANTFQISQTSAQSASSKAALQSQDMGAFCNSAGSCTQRQSETLNGADPTLNVNVCGPGRCASRLTITCDKIECRLPVVDSCSAAGKQFCQEPCPLSGCAPSGDATAPSSTTTAPNPRPATFVRPVPLPALRTSAPR